MIDDRWTVIEPTECQTLLRQHHLGRLAFVRDDLPVILPVNYVIDEDRVVFRTDPGTKFDAAARDALVAFEIDGVDPRNRTGWSVLVRGRAHHVRDDDELTRLRSLPLAPWAPGIRPHYVRIAPMETTGRRISIPALPPNYWG